LDTKSKKFKIWERTGFRVVIFLLCGVFAVGAVCLALLGEKRISEFQGRQGFYFQAGDIFFSRNFSESEAFRNSARNSVFSLKYLFVNHVEKEGLSIGDGAAFERAVDGELGNIYDQIMNFVESQTFFWEDVYDFEYRDEIDAPTPPPASPVKESYTNNGDRLFYWWDPWYEDNLVFDTTLILESPELTQGGVMKYYGESGVADAFKALFPEQVKAVRQAIAGQRQESYDDAVSMLAGVLYFISDGEKTLSNATLDTDTLNNYPAWIVIERNNAQSAPKVLFGSNDYYFGEIGGASLYIAWPEETITAGERLLFEARDVARGYFITSIALAVLAVVFFIMSIIFTGRKRPSYDDSRKLWAGDRIFVEFQILFFIIIGVGGGVFVSEAIRIISNSYMDVNYNIYIIIACCVLLVFVLLLLWFLLSLIRVGKARLFAERSLIARLAKGPIAALCGTIRSGYDGRNPLAKTLIFLILFWIVTALFAGICGMAIGSGAGPVFIVSLILLFIALGGAIHFTRKWAERYGHLRKGVKEIGSGNLGYKIDIEGDGKNEFDRLSALVNELGSAQNTAIQNELKNQRLKTDLISNVSHDLKTPLTSIITYTDLLKTEGMKSKNADEYLKIIDEKGRRLQKLTEDLFDAAKASSGAIPVRKEKVDLLALVRQEIAEMNGSFDAAGLELVIEAPEEHYYAEADSQLLWRVVDNLLRNARKYAQSGTRVYIELKEHNSMMTLEIKNTSAVKLNIPPEELMERFKRSDEARASEGSGLGLAIAKDLVRLQDGWFEVFIDGDLFKALVMLPPHSE